METNQKTQGTFSLFLATVLGINAVVGAGIFAMPLTLVKMAGPACIVTVILGMLCVAWIGIALARVSFLLPQEGGFYRYISAWAGKNIGVMGSAVYLVGLTVALGLLVRYVSGVIGVYMTGVSPDYLSYIVIVGTIVATFFASSLAAAGQTILFLLTIIPLFLIIYLCVRQGSLDHFTPFITHGWQGVFRGVPSVLFAFLGFESISSLARVIKNPGRTIPLATVCTIISVGILYIVFVSSVIAGVPADVLATKSVFSEVLLYAMPAYTWLVHGINFAIIVTVLGTIYAVTWSLSELLRAVVSKASNEKYLISETLGLLLIGFGMFVSMKFFINMSKTFSAVALCVVFAYALSSAYLLVRPARMSDRILGFFSVLSSLLIFVSACAQLI